MEKVIEEKAYQNNEAYQRTQMQKDMIIERLREQVIVEVAKWVQLP